MENRIQETIYYWDDPLGNHIGCGKEPGQESVGLGAVSNGLLPQDPDFAWVYEGLSPMGRRRIDQGKQPQQKAQRLASGFLLEQMLQDSGVCPPYHFVRSNRGRPGLGGTGPEAFGRVDFSLSHTKELSVCSLVRWQDAAGNCRVGVDVEKPGRYEPGIVRRFFTRQEQAFFAECADDPKVQEIFTRLWTGKEAVAKCFDLPLPQVCRQVNLLPAALAGEASLIHVAIAKGQLWPVKLSYKYFAGHVIALALYEDFRDEEI
jgi:phosphopantetheinyl transferase (holo-ACP synthase)